MKIRQRRMADEIQKVVGTCFQGGQMQDPRLSGVTITGVKVSSDLQIASLYYRVFDKAGVEQALAGLKHCKGFLRRKIADEMFLRRVPDLRFFHDGSVDVGARIEALIVSLGEENSFTNSMEQAEPQDSEE